MAFPTDTFTGASGDLDVMIPEVWGERMNDFFKEQLVAADFFVNRSDELAGGGDTLHTPNITEMSAATKSNATGVTLNSPTETSVDLVVNTWKEVSFMIEDREVAFVKKSYRIQETYAKNAAFTLAATLEVAIMTLFQGFSQTVGASTTNVADSEILQAIATLEANSVPGVYTGDVAFFMHPNTFYRQIHANINKFALAVNSPSQDPTMKRPIPTIYGIPVMISPNVPAISGSDGRANVLAHRDAIHWAASSLPSTGKSYTGRYGVRVQTNYMPDYLGFLTTADILFGVIENRDGAAVMLKSSATAV